MSWLRPLVIWLRCDRRARIGSFYCGVAIPHFFGRFTKRLKRFQISLMHDLMKLIYLGAPLLLEASFDEF